MKKLLLLAAVVLLLTACSSRGNADDKEDPMPHYNETHEYHVTRIIEGGALRIPNDVTNEEIWRILLDAGNNMQHDSLREETGYYIARHIIGGARRMPVATSTEEMFEQMFMEHPRFTCQKLDRPYIQM